MSTLLIHSDRVPSFETGTPTFHYAAGIVDPYRAGAVALGPLTETRRLDVQNRLLDTESQHEVFIIPPWDSANRKPMDNTIALCDWMFQAKMRVNLILDDLHFLQWMSGALKPFIEQHKGEVHVFSNFLRPEQAWYPGVPATFWFRPRYPFDTIREFAVKHGTINNEPKYDIGYVGRYFPKRLTILKRMGWKPRELMLLGPGWHKQDEFECAYAFDGGQPWIELTKVYRECRWHLVVQDKTQNSMWPAVSRIGECLVSGRPLLFHKSFVEGRPGLDWTMVRPWIVQDAAECREKIAIHSEAGYNEALRVQSIWAEKHYYNDRDSLCSTC